MNNRTLIVVIIILVLVGGILLLSGQFLGKKSTPSSPNTTTQEKQQNQRDAAQGTPLAPGEIQTITVGSSGFTPKSITIPVNKRVIWVNKSGVDVDIASDTFAPLNLGQFPDGSSVQLLFDKSGTYEYYNRLKTDQRGTVIVK